METSNKLCYWFLFYKDQLLLQKENDTYTIPYARIPQFRFLIRWRLITGMDFPRVRQNWILRWRGMTVTYIWGCVPLGIISRERVTRRRVRLINCFIGIAIAVSARYVVLLPCRLRRSRSNVLLANMRFIRQSQRR